MAIDSRVTYIACESTGENIPGNDAVYVKNLIPFDKLRFESWGKSETAGGTVVISADGTEAVMSTPAAAGGRAFVSITIPPGLFPVGAFVALGCNVEVIGTGASKDSINNGIAMVSGTERVITATTGRWCTIIETSADTGDIRIGLGTLTGEAAGARSIKITQPFLYQVASLTDAPHDWVPIGSTAPLARTNGNTVASGGGKITEAAGAPVTVSSGILGVSLSDSFGNDVIEWPSKFSWNARGVGLYHVGESGRTLAGMTSTWAAQINANSLSSAYPPFSFAVIQGGANDLLGGATLSAMQGSIASLVTTAKSSGLRNIFVYDIAPFGAHVSWTAGLEAIRVAYNDWLRYTFGPANRVAILRMSQTLAAFANRALMASGVSPDPNYDLGDGLHPNATGSAAIAALLSTAYSYAGVVGYPVSAGEGSASGTGISESLKKLAASDADVINLTGIRVDVYSAGTAPRVHRLSVDDATTDAAGVLTLDYDAIGTVGDTVALSIKLPDGRTVHADTTVKTLVP